MIYLGFIYIFLYMPLAVLVINSFNDAQYSLLWHGFTWRWYQELYYDNSLWIAAWHSLLLGISAATIATTLGTLAAVSLYRYRFAGRKLLQGLIFILILAPDIVTGVALLTLFSFFEYIPGIITLLLAHITFCIPFVVVTTYSRLNTLDHNLFIAAKDLGATEWQTFKQIILPLIWPAVLAAWLLSFTLSLDDVIISYFVAGPDFQILPLTIYSMVRSGIKPEINALSTVLLAVTFILVLISQMFIRKKS